MKDEDIINLKPGDTIFISDYEYWQRKGTVEVQVMEILKSDRGIYVIDTTGTYRREDIHSNKLSALRGLEEEAAHELDKIRAAIDKIEEE